jgi:hypothetical protein
MVTNHQNQPKMRITTIATLLLIFITLATACTTQQQETKNADKPLFRDPVHDGAADPVVIWNKPGQKWFMYYTNRRANLEEPEGVDWVHGTRIGIAESNDGGATWQYRDTCNINYRPVAERRASRCCGSGRPCLCILFYPPGAQARNTGVKRV